MIVWSRFTRPLAALVVAAALTVPASPAASARTTGPGGDPVTNDAGVTFGILSHRGGRLEWPENSVEAYTHSVAAGFDAIETDIVFTSDGRGVMSHYDTLTDRCTQAGRAIHQMTLAQVAEVRCKDLSGQFTVPIPTFEQLAEALAADDEVGLTLDIKTYTGQSAAGRRSWAKKAIGLVKEHGLLSRTSVISFKWDTVLPTILAAAPKMYVLALDYGTMDLDRVRLAAKLGAGGYGIRMKYTSAYLATYVKAKGMDSVPWEVVGTEARAFTIHYGGPLQLFSTDTPTTSRRELVEGVIDLNPVPNPTTTTLDAPVTISDTTYRADRKQYKVVGTKAVPDAALAMLRDVTVTVTVTGGTGTGSLYIGASSSPTSSSTRVALPASGRTVTVRAPLGDGRKLRLWTTRTVKLTVKVVAYTRVRFA